MSEGRKIPATSPPCHSSPPASSSVSANTADTCWLPAAHRAHRSATLQSKSERPGARPTWGREFGQVSLTVGTLMQC